MNIRQGKSFARVNLPSEAPDLSRGRLKSTTKPFSEFRLCMVVPAGEPDEILFPAQNLNRCHKLLNDKTERCGRPKASDFG